MTSEAKLSMCIDKLEAWVLGKPLSAQEDALALGSILSELCHLARDLPACAVVSFRINEHLKTPIVDTDKVRQRMLALEFNHYPEFKEITDNSYYHATTGRLSDDVVSVYQDLVAGNILFKKGDQYGAVKHWQFTMNSQWSVEATKAIQFLNAYRRQFR